MADLKALTEIGFGDAIASGVTLIDFWAEWCGPCRMIAPILEELAADFEGRAAVAKLNVDEAGGIAQEYGVSSIPTLLITKDGEEVVRFVGVTPKAELAAALEGAIG